MMLFIHISDTHGEHNGGNNIIYIERLALASDFRCVIAVELRALLEDYNIYYISTQYLFCFLLSFSHYIVLIFLAIRILDSIE